MSKDKNGLPIDKIEALAEVLKDKDLTEIEVESGDLLIRVRKEAPAVVSTVGSVAAAPVAAANTSSASSSATSSDFAANEIKAPMVGTFYAAPNPDSDPFVKVGDKVKKGDTLCIIEAMKIMNELPAEKDGEIVEICVSDSDAVSFGQTLFKLA